MSRRNTDVDTASRNKGDTSLGIDRLVLAQVLELVVLVLVVADVAITVKLVSSCTQSNHKVVTHRGERRRESLPLASKVEAVGTVIYKSHVSDSISATWRSVGMNEPQNGMQTPEMASK